MRSATGNCQFLFPLLLHRFFHRFARLAFGNPPACGQNLWRSVRRQSRERGSGDDTLRLHRAAAEGRRRAPRSKRSRGPAMTSSSRHRPGALPTAVIDVTASSSEENDLSVDARSRQSLCRHPQCVTPDLSPTSHLGPPLSEAPESTPTRPAAATTPVPQHRH